MSPPWRRPTPYDGSRSRPHGLVDFVRVSVRDPSTLGVVVAYLLGFVLHVVAIWALPLYLAQATVAMSLPITAVTSIVLHEHLRPGALGGRGPGLVRSRAALGVVR